MKQKIIKATISFLFYGILFGLLNHFTGVIKTNEECLKQAVFFGFFMTLGELFVYPKIKDFFTNRKIDQP